MDEIEVQRVRRFNRTVTQRIGVSQVSNQLGSRHFTSLDDVETTYCGSSAGTPGCLASPLVKAYMVAKNFMHLDIEKPIVHYILAVALALMVLLYGALAPDVQKGAGQGWKKDAGFHHSFTTYKPREPGHHDESAEPAKDGAGAPEQKEHDKP